MSQRHGWPVLTGRPGAGPPADQARQLPAWPTVLAVIAHPDDESFGLGAIIDQMTRTGALVHIVCFTHGEASTLNETGADLHATRCRELARASAELGIATVDLLDYRDGQLRALPVAELAARVRSAIRQHEPDGLLVFDETGITGHPDHRAATAAALDAARSPRLPVLAWTLPEAVASRLRRETGQPFAGHPARRIDLRVQVGRHVQYRAALAHASQISPTAVLWRRLQLLGDYEHLRWLPASPRVHAYLPRSISSGRNRRTGPGRRAMPLCSDGYTFRIWSAIGRLVRARSCLLPPGDGSLGRGPCTIWRRSHRISARRW